MEKGVDGKPGRKRLIYTVGDSKGEFGGTGRRATGMKTQITTWAVLENKEALEVEAEIQENHFHL